MSKRKRSDIELREQEIRELLPDALRLLDLDMPTTLEQVSRAEAELENQDIYLPDSLKDPFAILERGDRQRAQREDPPPAEEILEELRKVARFGNSIPEDVQEKMTEDRSRAEREAEDQREND